MKTSKKLVRKKRKPKADEPFVPDEVDGFLTPAEVEAARVNHGNVRRSASPEMLEVIHESDRAFAEMTGDLDSRLIEENKLREWGKNLCGFPLDISELEELAAQTKPVPPCGVIKFEAKRGIAFIAKTQSGIIVNVQRYIFGLEKVVIDLDTKNKDLGTQVDTFTNYGFLDLMKIAFKRLTTRRK